MRATGEAKHTLALLINSTFSLAVALSEDQQGSKGSDKGMQHSDFSLDELQDSPFPIPRKKKKKSYIQGQ